MDNMRKIISEIPGANINIQAQNHQSTTGYTPYENWKVNGRPWMTILRGKILIF